MKQPLFPTVFETCYVVSNMDNAVAMFADKFGVKNFRIDRDVPMNNKEGQTLHVGLGYAGDTLIELFEQTDNTPSVCEGWVDRKSDNAVRLHHYGFIMSDEVDFEDFRSGLLKQGMDIPIVFDNGATRALIADFRNELGHYLEYIQFEPEGREFLATIPRN